MGTTKKIAIDINQFMCGQCGERWIDLPEDVGQDKESFQIREQSLWRKIVLVGR